MPFAKLIAHRNFVIAVNAISLLLLLYVVFEDLRHSGSAGAVALLFAIAPTAGILAFVTPQRIRQWLIAALVINGLSLLTFSVLIALARSVQSQSVPLSIQAAGFVVVLAAPLFTIAACVLRLPRPGEFRPS
jgi:hypothetical protein